MKKVFHTKVLTPFWCLTVLTGLNLFNYLDRYILASVLTPMKESLNLSDGQMGRLSTVFMIGYVISCPFFGYLGDKITRKWLLIVGIFVWSVATLSTGLALTFGGILFWRVLVGLGESSYATISPSLISDVFPKTKQNNALTIFYAAIPVGSALGYLLGGLLCEKYGWREAFMFAGAPGLLLALTLAPFKEPTRVHVKEKSENSLVNFREILALFKIKEYNLTCWGYTAYQFGLGAFAFWGPTFLHRAHKIPAADASMFFGAVLVVAGFLGTLSGGFLASHWQKKSSGGFAWMCAISVFLAAPISLFAFWTPSPTLAMAALALSMFFTFFPTGPVNTLVIQTAPAHLSSSAMAISIFLLHVFGDMWSPEIVGRLTDRWGHLEWALSILPLSFLLASFLWAWLALHQEKRQNRISTWQH